MTQWLLYRFIGASFPNLFLIQVFCALALLGLFILSWQVLNRWVLSIPGLRRRMVLKPLIPWAWMILVFVVVMLIANFQTWPVPVNPSTRPAARGSLRSTAPDLAAMLIELGQSRLMSQEISSQMKSPQIRINRDFSWGLGIGIQHTQYGDALWQNGITFAYRSIMVYYPQEGYGIVVLTNSATGLSVAYDVAERALGGEAKWKYF